MSLLSRTTDITGRIAQNYSLDAERISWDFLGAPHGGKLGPFEPPDPEHVDPEAAIWLRPRIRPTPNTARPWGINNAPRYARGLIVGQVFFVRYTSPKLALEYADEFAALFHRETFGSIRCEDFNGPDFVEIDRWPNFKPIQVVIPYYIQEVN